MAKGKIREIIKKVLGRSDTINPDGSVTTHGKGGDITRYPDQQTTKITQTPEQEQKWKAQLPQKTSGGGGGGSGGTSGTSGTTTTSTSGGRKSSGISTPTVNQQNMQEALDVPTPSSQGTVTKAVANVGIKSAINYFKYNQKENLPARIIGTAQVLFGQKTGGVREKLTKGVTNVETKTTNLLTKGFPSSRAESNYTSTVNDFNSKSDNLNRDIANYESQVAQYPNGAPPDVYARLIAKQDELNSRIANQTAIAKDLTQQGANLKKSNTLSKVGVGVVEGVIGTIAFIPKLALHPIKTAKETVQGLTQLPQSIYDQPARTVGGLIGSVGTGWLIGKVGGRLIHGKPVDMVKLNKALEGAKPTPVRLIETTSESKIKYYKLSPDVESQALAEIKAGRSVKIQESKITNPDPVQQKIIDKGLGKTKILSLDVVNNVGNTIARRTFIGVEIKKGIFTYKETTLGKGQGIYNPDLNIGVIDTNFLGFNKKAQPVNVFKERNIIKFNQPVYDVLPESYKVLKSGKVELLNNEQILRLIGSKSYNFEGGLKVRAPPKQLITFKNYQDVVSSEFNRFPSSKTNVKSIQSLQSLEQSNAILSLNENPILGAVGRELTFKTLLEKPKTNKIPKPFEFDKIISKKMKPFNVLEDLNLKALEQPKTSPTSQILEQPKPIIKSVNTFDIGQLPSFDFTPQIKASVKAGVTKVITTKKYPSVFNYPNLFNSNFKQQSMELKPEQLKALSENNLFNINQILKPPVVKGKNKGRTGFGGGSITATTISPKQIEIVLQSPAVTQKQMQSLMQSLKQPQKLKQLQITTQIFKPYIPIPVIPKPITPFPILPSFEFGGGQSKKRFLTRNKKPTPAYTSSLFNAAFSRKALRVTPKQLKALGQRTYTGLENRPLVALQLSDDEKEVAKGLRKVNF